MTPPVTLQARHRQEWKIKLAKQRENSYWDDIIAEGQQRKTYCYLVKEDIQVQEEIDAWKSRDLNLIANRKSEDICNNAVLMNWY